MKIHDSYKPDGPDSPFKTPQFFFLPKKVGRSVGYWVRCTGGVVCDAEALPLLRGLLDDSGWVSRQDHPPPWGMGGTVLLDSAKLCPHSA